MSATVFESTVDDLGRPIVVEHKVEDVSAGVERYRGEGKRLEVVWAQSGAIPRWHKYAAARARRKFHERKMVREFRTHYLTFGHWKIWTRAVVRHKMYREKVAASFARARRERLERVIECFRSHCESVRAARCALVPDLLADHLLLTEFWGARDLAAIRATSRAMLDYVDEVHLPDRLSVRWWSVPS